MCSCVAAAVGCVFWDLTETKVMENIVSNFIALRTRVFLQIPHILDTDIPFIFTFCLQKRKVCVGERERAGVRVSERESERV